MSRNFSYVVFAITGIAIAALIAVLCVVFLPQPAPTDSFYKYAISKSGIITWKETKSGLEKLKVSSNVLKQLEGKLTTIPTESSCGQLYATIKELNEPTSGNVQCWEVHTMTQEMSNCEKQSTVIVRDCLSMNASNNSSLHWFGGAEMIVQKWPINGINLEQPTSFLSSDLPKRHGNVLERYYLSSAGAAVYIYPNVPLFVSIFQEQEICLEASYDKEQLVGPTYLKPLENAETLELAYAVCIGETAFDVHQVTTNTKNGFIKRPKELPDIKMLKEPIWSTWVRYKASINQTIIEQFASEILFHNFSNSQLEIDDGYEKYYGDFTFDTSKFPDAKGMVDKLHEMGFRVTIWVTPFVNLDSVNYETARMKQYFIPISPGVPDVLRWWNGEGSVIDFTNQNASNWYKDILEASKSKYGIDSFKFDAGETTYMPKSGLNFTAVRRVNPSDYTTAYAETAFEVGGSMAEMRSSWKTQDKNFYMRLMDKGSRWGELRAFHTLIPAALTFSILGYPYILPDMIGGNAYGLGSNLPERELYIRWLELAAFLPTMQFSVSPWQYDEEVTQLAHRYVDLHKSVVYVELIAAAQRYISGELSLLVAPVWFHAHSDETAAFAIDDEFLVGDKYLVAPILEQGSTQRNIYLPGGESNMWKDKMRGDCDEDQPDCIIRGGSWVEAYNVPLEEISWWEKLP